jgi:mannose-6-phosphate isomerase-like protein (cupin superfamily)
MNHFKITLVASAGPSMAHSHFHDDFEIFFLLEGKRDIFIKDQTHTVLPQSLVFINP